MHVRRARVTDAAAIAAIYNQGIYEKHGQLDGVWRDVVIVEYLFPASL